MVSKKVLQSFLICALVALFSLHVIADEEKPLAKFSKILPEKVGEYRKQGKGEIVNKEWILSYVSNSEIKAGEFGILTNFYGIYKSPDGTTFQVQIHFAKTEQGAYSLFTIDNALSPLSEISKWSKCEIGTMCFGGTQALSFIKGNVVVKIFRMDKKKDDLPETEGQKLSEAIYAIGKLTAENLEQGEGDVPDLVKHLPAWEKKVGNISYVLTHNALKYASRVSQYVDTVRPVIEAVPLESGIEAVVANYDNAKLVIIEYNTPQIASDADQRITQKINELKSQNQPVPTAYKRVGNYSVFVFDAPDEATANNLISQIDYGKTVQWLYGDPFENDRANRRYLLVTGGIIVTVLKTAGIALLLCFGIGGGFGYFVFMRRRKQQSMSTAFSDAGGMMRLNLDDMTSQTDPARLLEK